MKLHNLVYFNLFAIHGTNTIVKVCQICEKPNSDLDILKCVPSSICVEVI